MANEESTYNPATEAEGRGKDPKRSRLFAVCAAVGAGIVLFVLANLLFPLPSLKQMYLKRRNAVLMEKIEYLNQKTRLQAERLGELEMRDNKVYRPIFGMDEIPTAVRNAGYTSAARYSLLQDFDNAGFLTETVRRQDIIEKKATLQSKSFDDIEKISTHLEDMAHSIPTLFPVCPAGVSITSPFGYRLHPIFQSVFFHSGTDIAGQKGTPIYAAADGVVTDVKYSDNGYGNEVDINHGFGYSTRYAHLHAANVVKGQKVSRGDQIATMGSSGRATGVHLHYEVLYKSQQVNPRNFFDSKIDPKLYMTQVRSADKLRN